MDCFIHDSVKKKNIFLLLAVPKPLVNVCPYIHQNILLVKRQQAFIHIYIYIQYILYTLCATLKGTSYAYLNFANW